MRNRILQRLEDKKRKQFQQGGYGMLPMQSQGVAQELPGGMVTQIPGSDAVEFSGQSHDQGGIMMDNITEVEDGETMDQVTVAKHGGKRDYFFSSHLKEGGVPFSELHKQILSSGGSQEDIDYLAKMQEKKAGRKDGVVKAKLGGVIKYQEGGRFTARSEKTKKMIEILKAQGYDVPDVTDLGEEGIAGLQKSLGKGYYGEQDITSDENKQDFYERNKNVLNKIDIDGDGTPDINSWEDFNPTEHTGAFQSAFNEDMMSAFNNDAELMKKFEEAGLSGDDLQEFGFYGKGATSKDDKYGEYTFSRVGFSKPEEEPKEPEEEPVEPETPETTTDITEKKQNKDYSGALLGLGSMIPAVMAFRDKPDYMEQPDLTAPGIVKAERVAKQHLDRVDFNDQLARNAADASAMNKFIDTSGGGPASMANKMALYAKKQTGDREIQAQEERANIAIANEEANLDNKRKVFNAEAALDASKFNVGSQERASMENTRNKMLVDEFNRGADAATKDRKLNAVQYGINTLATLHRDKMLGKASSDFSHAIDGQRDAYERWLKSKNIPTPPPETTTTTPLTEDTESARKGGYRKLKLMRRYGK